MQQQILHVTKKYWEFSLTLITAPPGPAEAAAAVAGGSIAFVAIAAVATAETADPEPARRAACNQTAQSRTQHLPGSPVLFVASHRVRSPLPCVQDRTSSAR